VAVDDGLRDVDQLAAVVLELLAYTPERSGTRVMNDERHLLPKAEALAVLRRTGVPEETIQALDAALDDPVDVDRHANLIARYGITREHLVDRMGGSL
jgi:hypothetical protein